MDYEKIVIEKLINISVNHETLFYDIAILFAKTGFYENSIRIKYKGQDPFEIIIEKQIIPNIDNINVVFYDGELVGFYLAHLLHDVIKRDISSIPPINEINWHNHGNVIYNFYEVYFENNEYLIDNIAFKEQFQRKGIYSNIIYPILLNNAIKLNAVNVVMAVFKVQNYNAYQAYLKQGFKEIATLKFKLEAVNISPNSKIEPILEELVLLRLPLVD